MQKISAGILLYRIAGIHPEFLLVHPGGPYFARKDAGYWTIPKGEPSENESLIECARREFFEETGSIPNGSFIELTPVRQKAGKLVHAWLVQGDLEPSGIKSNMFSIPWPPGSDSFKQFPEIDKAAWMNADLALEKINAAQQSLIHQACALLGIATTGPAAPHRRDLP